jgi:hypothetical protein
MITVRVRMGWHISDGPIGVKNATVHRESGPGTVRMVFTAPFITLGVCIVSKCDSI